jgi:hypothetical protein
MGRNHNIEDKEEDWKRRRKEARASGTSLVIIAIAMVIIDRKRNKGSITYFLTCLLWLVHYNHQGEIMFK